MARAASDQILYSTLLDLVWRLGAQDGMSEEELCRAILELIENHDIRLTGTYRDILLAPTVRRRPGLN